VIHRSRFSPNLVNISMAFRVSDMGNTCRKIDLVIFVQYAREAPIR
jgi:hypothetical protein